MTKMTPPRQQRWCRRTPAQMAERYLVPLIAVLVLVTTGSGFWYLNYLQSRMIVDMAEQGGRLQTELLSELRSLYTAEVVEKVRGHGIKVSADYLARPDAIPLPASLTIALGEQIAAHGSEMQVRLYSDYPFPSRRDGGARDDFERAALSSLRRDPKRQFFSVEQRGARLVMRYAVADVMRAQCIGCHNNDPNSPKRDWKVGDVRGVLEITRPLAATTGVVRHAMGAVFGAIGLSALLALAGGAAMFHRQRAISRQLGVANNALVEHQSTLEQKVGERTSALTMANADLSALNARLSAAHVQMLESEKLASLGQLAAGLAHEINNPISFILSNFGALESYLNELLEILDAHERAHPVLSEPADPNSGAGFLRQEIPVLMQESKDGIVRIKQIVQHLREFARVDHGQDWQHVNVLVGINATLALMAREIDERADLVVACGPLPEIECKLGELNQVFLNVIRNALQSMEGTRGRLTVTTSAGPDQILIEVSDTGCGFNADIQSRIFDPFFTTKGVGKNTGLGLSVAYGILQKHRGSISIESTPKVGTTVRICLPIRQS